MNNTVRFGSFVLSCAIAGAVFAQGAPAPVAPAPGASASAEFSVIDTNKDGKVSSTEAQSNSDLRSAFSSLDADKDTYLTQSEFSKWNKAGKSGAMPAPGQDRSTGGASSNSISEPADASPKSSDSAESSEQK